jgi:heavy metal translocating P-type ATPase
MLQKIWHFFRHYLQFSLALAVAVVALGLELGGLHLAAHWLLGVAAIASVFPLLWGMWEDLRMGTYGVDILAATAIVTAVVMHEYWAALVIVLMLTGGESLEDYAEHRAKRELDALLTHAPQKAHVLHGRKETDIAVSEVQAGNKLVIRPGEVVPVDATLLEGESSLDESSLTGESLPQVKKPGDSIMSGSINIDGALTVKALASAKDSQYEQIIKLVRAAQNSQTPFVRLADRYSVPFTVISFGVAIAAWAISGQSIRFLEVLVVATPCPLILAAPIAVISGMSRAAKHGIIIKTGGSLERLALARTFAFDKTGTLTRGELQVDRITAFGEYTPQDVLGLAASIEQHSNHVLARAVVERARKDGAKLAKSKQIREIAGNGLMATLHGKTILVGRLSLLHEHHVQLPKKFKPDALQETAALVAIDGELAGVITFKDEIREESKGTLEQLRNLGIKHFLMVTGDNAATAKTVAKRLGIEDVTAEALPGDKLRAIEALTNRPVAFVGDGVNDAPVLTASDVGIALGARGSTAASESADVVVMLDDLSHVAKAVEIAKRTFFIAKQSILIGIGLSITLMLVFSTGKFPPLYGAIIQELVDVVVIFNALRAHGRFGASGAASQH